ncbi:MAG: hypothetical protein HP497_06585 [Nitrospira sp.]|nr:hypothetical protein [Nitrospira sp.]
MGTGLVFVPTAQAIPAFSRKYEINCTVCHTAPPRLNTFGERFLENGYQLPGTEDGGITAKKNLGDLNLDDVTNYIGVRLRGNVLRHYTFEQQNPPVAESGVVQNKAVFGFPEVFSLFTAGTLAKNIGFFAELESHHEEDAIGIERAFLTFNNILGKDIAHVRVGKFDPSATSSFSTLRQQLEFIGESVNATTSLVQRAGLFPLAIAAKFYGLRDRSGTDISPYAPSLYNAVAETGVEVRGRPFGDWFMYQLGMLNGSHERFGDLNKGKDVYGAIRFDYAWFANLSASLSGFAYLGNSNATIFDGSNNVDVNWHRYGIAAHLRYKMMDLYGMFTLDQINQVPSTMVANFDRTASGLTIAADAYVTDRTLVSVRYDSMDAGGDRTQRVSQSFVGLQVKQYVRTNVAIYARNDFNVRNPEDGNAAARNLRNAFFVGIDVAY